MTEGRVEDPALAESDGEEQGLVLAGPAGLGVRKGRGQDGEVLGRSAQAVIEFVFRVHPFLRQSLHDGVLRLAGGHLEGMLAAMAAARARRGVAHDFAFPVKPRSGLFIAPFPTADADHLIVLRPFGESVVGGVDRNEAAAVANEGDQLCPKFLGPEVAVVVGEHHRHAVELGLHRGHVTALAGQRHDLHREASGSLKDLLQVRRGRAPVVVVLAVDEEHAKAAGIRGEHGHRQPHGEQQDTVDHHPTLPMR